MIFNPDLKIVGKIQAGLEKTGGYCPCEIQKTACNICPCEKMQKEKTCKCKLYVPVIIYSASWCTNCDELKRYMRNQGIVYEIRDIEKNEEYRNEVLDAGFISIPVLKLGDLLLDPSKDEYKNHLKNKYIRKI